MNNQNSEIIIYQPEDGAPKVSVRLEGETVWLTQKQLAELFDTTQQNISLHVQNIYGDDELEKEATHKDILLVQKEGERTLSPVESAYLDSIKALQKDTEKQAKKARRKTK